MCELDQLVREIIYVYRTFVRLSFPHMISYLITRSHQSRDTNHNICETNDYIDVVVSPNSKLV